jgi:2-oxo-4-hydroxy-4-carboxy-5-ureidoimidazoline decarboxylase
LTLRETALLTERNRQYRARFGFPFIICALRHSRDSIFAEFARRLGADAAAESRGALAEVAQITALRLVRKATGPGMPSVYGTLSTHLLDTTSGRPAAGVPIELYLLAQDGSAEPAAVATSNKDGRTDAPLIAGRPIPRWHLVSRQEYRGGAIAFCPATRGAGLGLLGCSQIANCKSCGWRRKKMPLDLCDG